VEIREQVGLAGYTTFGVGGAARFFAEAKSEPEVAEAVRWSRARGVRLFVLGDGSNLLVEDKGFDGLVLRVEMKGVTLCWDGCFEAGAGGAWDQFVAQAVDQNFAGVECLAGIPGSVGGTPVQNVGAYGQEVSETIERVFAFDRKNDRFTLLNREQCRFRYRESLFNADEPGRYIVTRVWFKLRPGGAACVKYADVQRRFAGQTPSLAEVADAVRQIRAAKGMLIVPGDADSRSAGSFFKNPIVPVELADRIVGVPRWVAGDGLVKLPAAWLLEQAGFVKGYGDGPVRISSKHTLALTNRGGATFADVAAMQEEIVAGVFAKFGVRLEREPVVLG